LSCTNKPTFTLRRRIVPSVNAGEGADCSREEYTNLGIPTLLTDGHNPGMASWAFTCKHCQWVFTYSKIGETLADFIAEEKPKLPPEGVECICPHCKIKGTYHRYELIYQKSTMAAAR